MWEAWAEWDVRKKLIALPPLSAGNLHGDLWIVRSAPLWNRHGNRVSQRAAEFDIGIRIDPGAAGAWTLTVLLLYEQCRPHPSYPNPMPQSPHAGRMHTKYILEE